MCETCDSLKSDNAALRAQVESQATFYSTPEGGWFAAWEVAIQDRAKLERELAGARSNLYNAESERDALLREKAEREWIKCSERMPDHDGLVLVCRWYGPKAILEIARYGTITNCGTVIGLKGWWRGLGPLMDVTHWMPLPEPPDCGHPVSTVEVKG